MEMMEVMWVRRVRWVMEMARSNPETSNPEGQTPDAKRHPSNAQYPIPSLHFATC